MRRKRADLGALNNWPTFQQCFFTFSETYSHGIPGFYSVSVAFSEIEQRAHCLPGASQHIDEFYLRVNT